MKLEDRVYSLLQQVAKGKVTTYKDLALRAGTSPRVVGKLMAQNKDPENIPCFKVLKSDGHLGGYSGTGGIGGKEALLEREGIKVINGKVDLEIYRDRNHIR